jgi:outer membrane protein
MMKRVLACLLLIGVAAFSPAVAVTEAAKPPSSLTLQECIDIALRNQIDIKVAQNNITISKDRRTQALSDYFPKVSLQNNTFHTGTRGVLGTVNNGTALTVTQNFWDGGVREANVSGARYGVMQNKANSVRTTQNVIFVVTTAYYNVLRTRHLAEVAESNVKYNEASREIIQTRAQVGDVAKSDVLPVEAQLANARVALVSAQNDVRTAAIQLQNTMGVSPETGFDVQEVGVVPEIDLQTMDSYVQTGIAARPDVAAAKAGVGAANSAVKAARIPIYPIPLISGEYERGINTNIRSSSQIVGSIVFDVFDGNSNRAALQSARASRSTAQDQSDQLVKDIQAQVQQAYLNLTSAKERLSASDVGLAAAQSNYEVQSAKYKEGLAIPLDLLNAEVQVVTAQTNQVQARYDYYTAIAQLEFAVGKQGGLNEK